MITKQGMGLWSTTPPEHGFRAADTTEPTYAATDTAEVEPDFTGRGRVLGYTVGVERGQPDLAVLVVGGTDGDRSVHTVALSEDPGVTADLQENEWIGREVEVAAGALV
jgi:hypothetical protein